MSKYNGKLVFVSVPSKGQFHQQSDGSYRPDTKLLRVLAQLQMENPEASFICFSLESYAVVHLLDGDIAYTAWRTKYTLQLKRCDLMLILPFKSWMESKGVADEQATALELGIPIEMDTYRSEYL